MSPTPSFLASRARFRSGRQALGRLATAVLMAFTLASGVSSLFVQPASAAIGPVCPTPPSQVANGIDLCVDRGDNATYKAGDQITICVSANIPQIMIYPPPPPPHIKVEGVAADGSTRLL